MKDCICKVFYQLKREDYVTSVTMIEEGLDVLDMLWDTGACSTIIYSNLLRGIKNVDEHEINRLEKCLKYNKKERTKAGYKYNDFIAASKNNYSGMPGILYCTHNVYVNHLHLKNFYFYIVSADTRKSRGLLGADFISCCKRQCEIASDEIFTQFDEQLYERKFSTLCINSNCQPYSLYFLMDTANILQQSTSCDIAEEVNAFLN